MKHLIRIVLIMILTQTSFSAETAKNFQGPKWAYFALASAFPEFNESIGGFSYEMNLKNLLCSASFVTVKNEPKLHTECTATDLNDKTITRSDENLYLTLYISAQVVPDTHSEPGTVYFEIDDINCGVLEPRSSDPDHPVEPEYFCSGK